jgi:hypothetical protein
LFNALLEALSISSGKSSGRKSPVSVAKALHLLAPGYFPLWDDKIARAYNCYYNTLPAEKYYEFCQKMKRLCEKYKFPQNESPLKIIDEYNYAKYTKHWI